MSRNQIIRKLAENMPETTLVKGDTIMTDGYDHPLLVNHFRVMKKIEKEQGKAAVARYVDNIFMQEEARLLAEKKAADRRKSIEMWLNVIAWTVLVLALIGTTIWMGNQ